MRPAHGPVGSAATAGAKAGGRRTGDGRGHGRGSAASGSHGRRRRAPQVSHGPDRTPSRSQAKVRQIGTKTFYWKNSRWVDSSVTPDEDAKATVVTQFTDAYFQLARTQKAEYNQYLSQTEPVTVKLDGQGVSRRPGAAGTGTLSSRGWSSRHSIVVRTTPARSQAPLAHLARRPP